jgi:hypothetical protein
MSSQNRTFNIKESSLIWSAIASNAVSRVSRAPIPTQISRISKQGIGKFLKSKATNMDEMVSEVMHGRPVGPWGAVKPLGEVNGE